MFAIKNQRKWLHKMDVSYIKMDCRKDGPNRVREITVNVISLLLNCMYGCNKKYSNYSEPHGNENADRSNSFEKGCFFIL